MFHRPALSGTYTASPAKNSGSAVVNTSAMPPMLESWLINTSAYAASGLTPIHNSGTDATESAARTVNSGAP